MPDLLRIARTVAHLTFRQAFFQVNRRFGPKPRISPFAGEIHRRNGLVLSQPITRSIGPDDMTFTFLNVTKRFDSKEIDWTTAEMSKLWRYNLHYFDYLQGENRIFENKSFLINDWIKNNPQGAPDAWEPFPVSLRIVNWIKFFFAPQAQGILEDLWLRSLYEQALWLEKNLERHLLANHYFKNGKALFFAGLFFTGADAERWLKKGLKIVSEELEEQILPDGGHFERSPMYHAMILEDCLDLLNIGKGAGHRELERLVETLAEKCRQMIKFLYGMSHPDGEIALFNDAAFGIEATSKALAEYYERLTGERIRVPSGTSWSFPETGYYVMSPKPGDRLIIDCGPVGPDYQPGHSHCDSLSFELSLKGRRVIVDSGCCQYVEGDIRRYNRGNKGHNTVTIDGENQSEVWGAHRCGRRAYPLYVNLEERANGSLLFSGAHNGYRHLKGSPVHNRTITWSGDTLLVEDRVEGKGSHDIEARLHIHSDLVVELTGGNAVIRDDRDMLATITLPGEGSIEKTEGWYCPEFGIKRPCVVLTHIIKNVSLPFDGGWIITTGA